MLALLSSVDLRPTGTNSSEGVEVNAVAKPSTAELTAAFRKALDSKETDGESSEEPPELKAAILKYVSGERRLYS